MKTLFANLVIVGSCVELQSCEDASRVIELWPVTAFDTDINQVKCMDLVDDCAHNIDLRLWKSKKG